MRKVRQIVSLAAFSLVLSSWVHISPASALTVGSGNCIQNVGSTAGITVSTYSDRCVVKFTSTTPTTWTVPRGVSKIWLLVVGGGGGGGSDEGGGGGGGGYIETQTFLVAPTSTISLAVGTGGTGASDTSQLAGGDGGDSTFATLTAVGGGGAGSAINASSTLKDGRIGGSGGGGAGEGGTYRLGVGGAGTTGQGFAGGGGYTGRGGGGGGAAEVGNTNGTSMGGDGKGTKILNGSTNTYFAGGGGGGGGNSGTNTGVVGGAGGGGAGGAGTTCAVDGTANTGGGGGGAGSCNDYSGGTGGTGVIIVNYQFDITAPTITSLTSQTIAENTAITTNVLTLKASESTTITIAAGQDGGDFVLIYSDSVTSFLRFAISPDYEGPADVGLNNVYDITLNLEDYFGNVSTQAIVITVTDLNEVSTVSALSLSATPYKGIQVTITISVNAQGKILFTANGKRIAGCLAVRTTGSSPNYSATCNWKPTVTGRVNLQAVLTPTSNTFSVATSENLATWVVKRTTNR